MTSTTRPRFLWRRKHERLLLRAAKNIRKRVHHKGARTAALEHVNIALSILRNYPR